VIDTLAWLGSRHESPPPGVFTHDLFKPFIWLAEDVLALMPRTSPGEDSLEPVLETPSGKGGAALTSEANPGTLAGQVGQDQEPGGEIATIIGSPGPDVD
jgi:hypothetical protein